MKGLYPTNTTSMDNTTRIMLADKATWPMHNKLPMKRRSNPMVFGYVDVPASSLDGKERILIHVEDGSTIHTTIDDALRAGWTVD
jgi:hypothetical protein